MKAYVPRIPKMWYFLGLAVFKVELLALKVRSNSKKNPAKKCHKKRHGHNFGFSALKQIAQLLDIVENPCYSFHGRNPKIVAVSFFSHCLFAVTHPLFPPSADFEQQ